MNLMVRAMAVIGFLLVYEDLLDGAVSRNVQIALFVFLAFGLWDVLRPRTRR